MPKGKNPHPHVSWRDGRPRFSPGRDLRALGYRGKDLRHADGRWYTKGEAVDWSIRFQEELTGARKKPAARKRKTGTGAGRTPPYTLARLVDDWRRSPRYERLGENTRRDYRQKLRIVEEDHDLIWNAPVAALDQPTLRAMFEEIWTARGLASAGGTVRVLSSALSWAMLRGKARLPANPAQKLQMELPAPRVRFATRREIDALVATADATGRPWMGDMVLLGVWTGQRQADRRAMVDKGLLNGRRIFRQRKTGAIVAVKDVPELERRLEAAKARRAAARAEALLAARDDAERERIALLFGHAVLDERRWKPIRKYQATHLFAELRGHAVAGVRAEDGGWTVEPCKSLADFWDLDLRDTAVTWMALAGATIPEIIAVTGHTAESATRILRHYLARHPEMADSAMKKMVEWYDGGGETEIGL